MVQRRAFIVSIETYALMEEGLAQTLAGTHAAATTFRRWLLDEQGLSPGDIYLCAEDPTLEGRTAGASSGEIAAELFRLKDEGKDRTDELYFLFVGHGLCYRDANGVRLADVLLGADYRRREVSGNACLRIDEIQAWLRLSMGPSDHYYFIDACRTDIGEREIRVGGLGLTYDNSSLGEPTVYTLYSVVQGAVAAADSGFVSVLVEALNGAGRAKVWYGGGMAVLFRSVKDYVERRLTNQDVDQRVEGRRDGLIRRVAPIPDFTCSVEVQGAAPADAFVLTVTDSRQTIVDTVTFAGPNATFARSPDDYMLAINSETASVEPLDPLPADLYQDATVRFTKQDTDDAPVGPEAPRETAANAPDVSILAPSSLQVDLRNLQTGEETGGRGGFSSRLAPGSYTVKMSDVGRGVTFGRRRIEIRDQPLQLDLGDAGLSDLHNSWLSHLPPVVRSQGGFDFSESLGPTGDTGMDLWLALFGASRVAAEPSDLSKLGMLPLARFDDAVAGDAHLYLLAGLEPAPERLSVGLSTGPEVTLEQVAQHPFIPGLFEGRLTTSPGHRLATLRLGDRAPISIGVELIQDCATLLTASTDEAGALRLQQVILPIRHLAEYLPAPVRAHFRDRPLASVREAVEVQRRFASSRDLDAALPEPRLNALIALEWFEPITATLVGYDLARRGDGGRLRQLVSAMRMFYSAPDVEALAKAAGAEWEPPHMPPLVLDGLLSLNLPADRMPLDPGRLDFRGPWATWKDAVAEIGSGALTSAAN